MKPLTVSSLAGRLARLNNQLSDEERARIRASSGGVSLADIVGRLLVSIDPDHIEEAAKATMRGAQTEELSQQAKDSARAKLVGEAAGIFNGELIELLDSIRRDKEQTIDPENLDAVLRTEWDGDAKENAEKVATDFQEYLEANRDEIEALNILYSQPQRRSSITYAMIRQLMEKLKAERPRLAPLRVWQAYATLDKYAGTQPKATFTKAF